MIVGHAHPDVVRAVQEVAADSFSFGAPTEAEVVMAEEICKLVPSIEQVRLVSSGTEATMSALRLARGFTGRDLIVKFEGCYHGHADSLLVKAGSGLLTFADTTQNAPSSAGVPEDVVKHTMVLPYNDVAALREAFARHGNEIAAVIVEPVAGNMNLVRGSTEFHQAMRSLCTENGAGLRAGAVRHHAGPDVPGQSHRWRHAGRSLWRAPRHHGLPRAAGQRVSGRDVVG